MQILLMSYSIFLKLSKKSYFVMIPLFFNTLLLSGCVSSTVVMRDDSVVLPKSRVVKILNEKPKKPYYIIATIETEGRVGTSLPEILQNMRSKAREIGADAIIPVSDVSRYKSPGIMYNPWLGGYQSLPGGRIPVIRGHAIVYKSTIRKLKRQGYDFYQNRREFRGGLALNAAPFVFNGYGGGAWLGMRKLRFVGEYFSFEIPKAFFTDEVKTARLQSGTRVGMDYFFFDNLKGLYLPVGLENWNYSVVLSRTNITDGYNMFYFSVGIGFLVPISSNFYFDTKFSLNVSMSNREQVQVGNVILQPDKEAYNLFVGLGVNF